RRLNRFIIQSADHVVAISSDTKQRAERYYGVRRPIDVINYGFIPFKLHGRRDPCTNSDENFQLIAVGRLVPRKGFDVLIRALKLLPRSIHLRLVGDGPLADRLSELASEEGVADRLHMDGFQTRERICKLMEESDCFVLSSMHEG